MLAPIFYNKVTRMIKIERNRLTDAYDLSLNIMGVTMSFASGVRSLSKSTYYLAENLLWTVFDVNMCAYNLMYIWLDHGTPEMLIPRFRCVLGNGYKLEIEEKNHTVHRFESTDITELEELLKRKEDLKYFRMTRKDDNEFLYAAVCIRDKDVFPISLTYENKEEDVNWDATSGIGIGYRDHAVLRDHIWANISGYLLDKYIDPDMFTK